MGLEELLRFLRRSGAIVLGTAVFVAAVAGLTAMTRPAGVEASIAFAVNRINRETTPDFQYDGYYALQASDLYAQTVVSWFSTPAVVRDIYAKANLPTDLGTLGAYAAKFQTKKYSAQNIVVRFTEQDEPTAAKLAAAVIAALRDRTATLNETADRKSLFEIVASDPVIAPRRPPVATVTVLGGLAGVLLGLFLASLREAAVRVRNADRA